MVSGGSELGAGSSFLLRYPLLIRFTLFCVFPILLLVVVCFSQLRHSLTPTSGTLAIAGLNFPVEITHDKFGAPSILARTDHDAYFTLGYKHASDRLWQLEMQRRLAQGRLSEVLGAEALQQDIWMRTLGLGDAARISIPFLKADTVAALTAYADGINSWIAQAPSLPMEFQILGVHPEPWTVTDSLSWQKVFALTLGGNMYDELWRVRLRSQFTAEQIQYFYPYDLSSISSVIPNSLEPNRIESNLITNNDLLLSFGIGHRYTGSNVWVISGQYTKSGHPILANDPHLGLQLPSLWYAAAMKGDKLDVSGMTLVGLPMVVLGRNADIAWGGANLMSDQQDLFVETTSPDHPNQYRRGNQWIPFEIKHEKIKVSAAFPSALHETIKPVDIVIRKSDRGPIVSDVGLTADMVLSLRWAALDAEDLTMESFFEIQYAKNWEGFRKALTKLKAPGMNFLYADRSGNIGYQAAGMMPKRAHGVGITPSNGSDVSDWEGYHNFETLPSIFNPDEGFIVSANNPVEGSSEMVISHEWAPSERYDRIVSLIKAKIDDQVSMTVSDMQAIQADETDLGALALLPYLTSITGETAQETAALTVLKNWDGKFELESVGASLFATWTYYLMHEVLDDELKGSRQHTGNLNPLSSSIGLISWPQTVKILSSNSHGWCKVNYESPCLSERKESLTKALMQLAKITGSHSVSKWKWSSLSATEFIHQPFGRVKGLDLIYKKKAQSVTSPNSVNASNLQFDEFKGFTQNFGSGFRQIFELDRFGNQWYMVSTGQSGNPMSPHFSDMIQPFSNNQLTKMVGFQRHEEPLKLIPLHERQP